METRIYRRAELAAERGIGQGLEIVAVEKTKGRRMTPDVWGTAKVDGVEIPVFLGKTYADHVNAWREVSATVQRNRWMLGAIAVRLERSAGGRPEEEGRCRGASGTNVSTAIQKFCRDVRIGRNTFQRYNRTYRVFAETRTTGGTRLMNKLPFKYFEVAGRLTDSAEDAVNAIAAAYEAGWSANELERRLAGAPEPKAPLMLKKFFRGLWQTIRTWHPATQRKAVLLLRQLAAQVERTLPPDDDDLPVCLRGLVVDYCDPIGERDVEVTA